MNKVYSTPQEGDYCMQRRAPCMHRLRGKHTVSDLRAARNTLLLLEQEAKDKNDTTAPVQSVKAAVVHLAAVERWLLGDLDDQVEDHNHTITKKLFRYRHGKEHAQELRACLQVAGGTATSEEVQEFLETFSPLAAEEQLLKEVACSARSNNFLHPGKLFLSTVRLCFSSTVMGVELLIVLDWEDVEKIELKNKKSAAGASAVMIRLKKPIMVDGAQASAIEIHVYDLSNLADIHPLALFFTGTGLFGEEAGAKTQAVQPVATTKSKAMLNSVVFSAAEATKNADLTLWELERRSMNFGKDWRAPFLPHDGERRRKWVILEDASYKVHPCLPDVVDDKDLNANEPPVEEIFFLGRMRSCRWKRDNIETDVDEDGWQYATDFYTQSSYWTKEPQNFTFVRRRKWCADFAAEVEPQQQQPPQGKFHKQKSTLMEEIGLQMSGADKQLLDVEIANISLADFGKALEDSNWNAGSLMALWFSSEGIKNLEVGDWATGTGAAAKVKGKVRSVTGVAPVPPAPMCPEETRITTSWHVFVADNKVIVENVTMSLDVPYGKCFNAVVCDRFTATEDGKLRLERMWGVEWVKSTFMRGLIESNVPVQLKLAGDRFVEVIKKHFAQGTTKASPS